MQSRAKPRAGPYPRGATAAHPPTTSIVFLTMPGAKPATDHSQVDPCLFNEPGAFRLARVSQPPTLVARRLLGTAIPGPMRSFLLDVAVGRLFLTRPLGSILRL